MAKSLMLVGLSEDSANNRIADNGTRYIGAVGQISQATNETLIQAKVRLYTATISAYKVYCLGNTTLVTSVFTMRKNGADTALTVSYTSGQSGQKEDTSNSFTTALGDLLSHKVVVPNDTSGAKRIIPTWIQATVVWDSPQHAVSIIQSATGGSTTFSAASTNKYGSSGRISDFDTTEANAKLRLLSDYTASHLRGYVASNARTTNVVYKVRKNGADGNQSVTWTSGQTGEKEDTTNTDTLASGDDYCGSISLSTGTGNVVFNAVSVCLLSAAGHWMSAIGNAAGRIHSFQNLAYPITGTITGNATVSVAHAKSEMAFDCEAVAISSFVESNTSATGGVTLLVGSTSTLATSYTSGQTGLKTDTDAVTLMGETNVVSFDLLEASSGSITYNCASVDFVGPIAWTQALADGLTLADSMANSVGLMLSDGLTLSDAIAKAVTQALSDGLTLADVCSPLLTPGGGGSALTLSLSDGIVLSDVIGKTVGLTLADGLTLSDAIARAVGLTLADGLTLSDALAKALTKALTDGIALADVISRAVALALNDGVTLTDTMAKSIAKSIADGLTLSDAISRAVGLSLSDGLTLADALAKATRLTLADGLTLADALAKSMAKSIADGLTLSDAIARAVGLTLADGVALSDSIAKKAGKGLADGIALADVISRAVQLTLADGVTITDSLAQAVSLALSDGLTLADALAKSASIELSDGLTLADEMLLSLIAGVLGLSQGRSVLTSTARGAAVVTDTCSGRASVGVQRGATRGPV